MTKAEAAVCSPIPEEPGYAHSVKILVVEDETKMARLLERGLREEGHQVDLCTTGTDALAQGALIAYDVILLDWSLPELDGLEVLRRWRERGVKTPVLLLTARGTVGERVAGLRGGADDYLTKPFDFEELLARVEALHRRVAGHETRTKLGPVTLDPKRRELIRGDKSVALTSREFALLSELSGHLGETVSRSELLGTVWGTTFDGPPNVVDVYIGYVRGKLREVAEGAVTIEAVRGVGYRLAIAREPKEKP